MQPILLSILSLTNYAPDIWDGFRIPEIPEMTVEDVKDTIMAECAELSLVYTRPETVKKLITLWTNRNLPAWRKLAAALESEYNPIHNYDRTEKWTDDNTGEQSSEGTTSVAGFNLEDGYADRDKAENKSNGKGHAEHNGHISGNIGVTTTQQMITEEWKMRLALNVTSVIVDSFKNNFCVQIY